MPPDRGPACPAVPFAIVLMFSNINVGSPFPLILLDEPAQQGLRLSPISLPHHLPVLAMITSHSTPGLTSKIIR